ncbi:nucleotide exchange factor GrpE [Candidatus Gottesmanbacteria bacterium RIFCSPHIGHO2_01_FULL_46_14]|uniref:Protein GrpE n=2 Tax=Candidatus Gottesmaniibacteriota TaxID=1752720 RepID=A0A1F5ZR62_9BACT|nr:MAG: nucleotide exchange factor GrpE [Candidatus Gottesmanbacteria bacterium RIFCSPHIGHO2_01_FULL_46_14]OGG30373.1 MAG: nucleotide exchange factor GrpE [Candidatus Gottesmanbacteria bacterium RIFCSPLOWO2_01_FULL_46_21]
MKKQVDQPSEEWKNKYLRALADYQNLEKRTRDEIGEVRKFASEVVLARLLPVVDTLKKAKDHIKDPGLDLTYKELLAVLEEQGVEKIEIVGRQFNPHEMECIEVIEGKNDEVVEEVLPGYRFRGKIIRVAQVKVGKE